MIVTPSLSCMCVLSCRLGASADYKGASFSANFNYNTMTQQSSSAQQSSFILNGQSSVGGYAVNSVAPVLDPYYVEAVQSLCSAYTLGDDTFQSQLSLFADSYGSSFVASFYYGGYAASVLQMSSYSYSSLQNQSISLSAAGQLVKIQAFTSCACEEDCSLARCMAVCVACPHLALSL